MLLVGAFLALSALSSAAIAAAQPCLCIFDIDRTLTGKQDAHEQCPDNLEMRGIWDSAYGGGQLSLSVLAQHLDSTFCRECHVGLISSGPASGHGSSEREALLAQLSRANLKGLGVTVWTPPAEYGTTPFILSIPEGTKQDKVEHVLDFHRKSGAAISADEVYFFDDKLGNVQPFLGSGYNAMQISCFSRDGHPVHGRGLCGATPDEVMRRKGVYFCGPSFFLDTPAQATPAASRLPPPPSPQPPAPSLECSPGCTPAVLATGAGGYTCAGRIRWLQKELAMPLAKACSKVADEFPLECGLCGPR